MFGKITDYTLEGQKLVIRFEEREGVIEAVTDEIINVFSGFETKEHRSKAIEGEKRKKVKALVSRDDAGIVFTTAKLEVHIADGFKVDIYDADGNLLCADYRGKREYTKQVSEEFLKLMDESGRSSWELLQNCYCMKDCHEQKIPLVLALTQLFLNKIGGGICRVHGGGFAGVIAAVVPENEMENYVEYISQYVGRENVYPMDIRAIGAVHIG